MKKVGIGAIIVTIVTTLGYGFQFGMKLLDHYKDLELRHEKDSVGHANYQIWNNNRIDEQECADQKRDSLIRLKNKGC